MCKIKKYSDELCMPRSVAHVESLIRQGANVNHHLSDGKYKGVTPLSMACFNGNLQIARVLLEHGADIQQKSGGPFKGISPFFLSIINGDPHFIELLLEFGANLNQTCGLLKLLPQPPRYLPNDLAIYEGFTPLHLAANLGEYKIISILLKRGADINHKILSGRYKGLTPIFAAIEGGHLDIVKLFLKNNSDINTIEYTDAQGESIGLLNYACLHEKKDIVEYLLNKGANPNVICKKEECLGLSLLMIAIYVNNIDILNVLVNNGAQINQKSELFLGKVSAISYAYSLMQFNILNDNCAIIEYLLKNGADVNQLAGINMYNDETLLTYSIYHDDPVLTALLIKHSADVNKKNLVGDEPICIAADIGNFSIIQQLLINGSSINFISQGKSYFGKTPLSIAIEKGHILAVMEFLGAGADPNLLISFDNDYKENCVFLASRLGRLEILQMLIENGAEVKNSSNISGGEYVKTAYQVSIENKHYKCAELLQPNIDHPLTVNNIKPKEEQSIVNPELVEPCNNNVGLNESTDFDLTKRLQHLKIKKRKYKNVLKKLFNSKTKTGINHPLIKLSIKINPSINFLKSINHELSNKGYYEPSLNQFKQLYIAIANLANNISNVNQQIKYHQSKNIIVRAILNKLNLIFNYYTMKNKSEINFEDMVNLYYNKEFHTHNNLRIGGKDIWRLFVDGEVQNLENGWLQYEKRERGSVRDIYEGWKWIVQSSNGVDEHLSGDYLCCLHRQSCNALSTANAGRFKVKDSRSLFNIDLLTIEGLKDINAQSRDNSLKFGFRESVCSLKITSSRKNIADKVSCILNNYEIDIKEKITPIEKIKSIVALIQHLGHLHPFRDGNCRTICTLLLNKELMRNSFPPVILDNPNYFDTGFGKSELIKEIIKGWENFFEVANTGRLYSGPTTDEFYALIAENQKNTLNLPLIVPGKTNCLVEFPIYDCSDYQSEEKPFNMSNIKIGSCKSAFTPYRESKLSLKSIMKPEVASSNDCDIELKESAISLS